MTLRNPLDPYGGPTPVVDNLIGTAYPVVRAVYMKLAELTYLSENLDNLTPRDIEFRGNQTDQAIEWRYVAKPDEPEFDWQVLVTYNELLGADVQEVMAFLTAVNQEVSLKAAQVSADALQVANDKVAVQANTDLVTAATAEVLPARDQVIAALNQILPARDETLAARDEATAARDAAVEAAEEAATATVFTQLGTGAKPRSYIQKMRDNLELADYDDVDSTGVLDSTLGLTNFIEQARESKNLGELGGGIFKTTEITTIPEQTTIRGVSPLGSMITRYGTGNLINSPDFNDWTLRDMTLDLRHSVNSANGHGISASGNRVTLDNLVVKDFGSDGAGGGTGILLGSAGLATTGHRMSNTSIYGNSLAPLSFGWIYADTHQSFAHSIYSSDIVGYAHELKNDARHNLLSCLMSNSSNWAIGYGQDTVGVDGSDLNLTVGVLGRACDGGLIGGELTKNLFVGMLFDQTGAPGREPDRSAVRLSGSASDNAVFGTVSHGVYDQTVYLSGNRNFVQKGFYDTSATTIRITAGSRQNFVDVVHPGLRTSIRTTIDDQSGNGLAGNTANVVHSPVTGERIGSVSGYFSDVLGQSGAAFNGNHRFRFEHNQYTILGMATAGNTGDSAGMVYAMPGSAIHGKVLYSKGATGAADYWAVGVNAADAFYLTPASIRPNPDNTKSCGEATYRWSVVYATTTTISSSDGNLKKVRGALTDAEMRAWAKVEPVVYQWLHSIAEKGEEAARLHAGYIAQQMEEAFVSEGLDVRRYAMFCEDDVTEKVKVVKTLTRQKTTTTVHTVTQVVVEDGRAVLKTIDIPQEVAEYQELPLFREDGSPVLDDKGRQVTHQIPLMEEYEDEHEEEIPAGKRLALRYDHCAVFSDAFNRTKLAAVQEELDSLKERVLSLEA